MEISSNEYEEIRLNDDDDDDGDDEWDNGRAAIWFRRIHDYLRLSWSMGTLPSSHSSSSSSSAVTLHYVCNE